jgi:hypothetical protein
LIIRPVVSKITLLMAVEAVRRFKPREIVKDWSFLLGGLGVFAVNHCF